MDHIDVPFLDLGNAPRGDGGATRRRVPRTRLRTAGFIGGKPVHNFEACIRGVL